MIDEKINVEMVGREGDQIIHHPDHLEETDNCYTDVVGHYWLA